MISTPERELDGWPEPATVVHVIMSRRKTRACSSSSAIDIFASTLTTSTFLAAVLLYSLPAARTRRTSPAAFAQRHSRGIAPRCADATGEFAKHTTSIVSSPCPRREPGPAQCPASARRRSARRAQAASPTDRQLPARAAWTVETCWAVSSVPCRLPRRKIQGCYTGIGRWHAAHLVALAWCTNEYHAATCN